MLFAYKYNEFLWLSGRDNVSCAKGRGFNSQGEHILEQWAAIYAAAPREQLGVRYLAQGHLSRGIEGEESHSPIHVPHLQSLPDLRLELATVGL